MNWQQAFYCFDLNNYFVIQKDIRLKLANYNAPETHRYIFLPFYFQTIFP